MLIAKLLKTRKTDAELPEEIRAALVESLFAPIVSLIVGAVACSIIACWILGWQCPRASTAIAATSELSMPPDNPSVTVLKPFLRT